MNKKRRRRRRFDEGETREALLDAAEELFSISGVEGVSIRSINTAAGLAAPSVHYHFGSKEDLLLAILRRRNEVVTRRLGELLDAMEARGRVPSVQELVNAVAGSYLELLKREPVKGMRWLRLMGRLWLAEHPCLAPLNAETGHLTERLLGFVCRMFPHESPQVLEARWRVAVSTLTEMLGTSDAPEPARPVEIAPLISPGYAEMVIEFVASGFSALMKPKRASRSARARTAAGSSEPPVEPGDAAPGKRNHTRELLMDAAEELFAAFGVEGVSIRSINATAGLSPPAVHYHFGSKDELLSAVLRRRSELVTNRLGQLLDELEAGDRRPTVRELVGAIASAYLYLLDREPVGGLRWLRLTARLWLARDPRLLPLDSEMDGLHKRLLVMLHRMFPRVLPAQLEKRWRLAASTLLQMLSNRDARAGAAGGDGAGASLGDYIDMLADFVASGFDAIMASRASGGVRRSGRTPVRPRAIGPVVRRARRR